MEFDRVGKHCELSSCNLLDFLPYKCDACSRTFCHSHYGYDAHKCEPGLARQELQSTALVCPICSQPVVPCRNEDPNQAISLHIDRGCPKRKRANPQCSHPSCATRDYGSTVCQTCHLTFCINHRLEADHPCLQNRTSRAVATKKRTPGEKRNSATAFLNTLTAALGDESLEPDARLYLIVHLPRPLAPRYMFFNRRFTAGRIIDDISSRVKGMPSPKGQRWMLYAVRKQGGVNLLPHMTPLSEVAEFVGDGDAVVVSDREGGLTNEMVAKVRKMGFGKRTQMSKSNVRTGTGLPSSGLWSKAGKLRKLSASKCIVS